MQTITLSDPDNCLMRWLVDLNLSSSPFSAIAYQAYTFYDCPITTKLYQAGFMWMVCLRNDTKKNATVASSTYLPQVMEDDFGCSKMFTVDLPVERGQQFDYSGYDSKLKLKWDAPDCIACEETGTYKKCYIMTCKFKLKYIYICIITIVLT